MSYRDRAISVIVAWAQVLNRFIVGIKPLLLACCVVSAWAIVGSGDFELNNYFTAHNSVVVAGPHTPNEEDVLRGKENVRLGFLRSPFMGIPFSVTTQSASKSVPGTVPKFLTLALKEILFFNDIQHAPQCRRIQCRVYWRLQRYVERSAPTDESGTLAIQWHQRHRRQQTRQQYQ